jgi:NitT/TauT family transport system substrate-binding protein
VPYYRFISLLKHLEETEMKKTIALLLVLAFCIGAAAGCSQKSASGASPSASSAAPASSEAMAKPAQTASAEPVQATPAEPVPLTIGFCTWIGYAPLYIAQEKGFFAKYGVNPKLTIIEDESEYAAALFSNSIQGLGNVLDREVIHFSKGTPETVLVAMDQSTGGDGIIASGEIKTVGDLKGKTVGLDKASTSYFFFLTVLDKYGMKETDVTISDMGADDAGAAFLAGKLDAAVTWEPYLSEASTRDGGHLLVSSVDFPNTIVDVLTVRSDFAEKNPKAAAGLAAAWYDAIDWYKANTDEGNAIMAKGLDLEVADVADMAKGITFIGRDENAKFFDKNNADGIYKLAQTAVDFWTGMTIIDSKTDVGKLISDTYYKAEVK